MTTWLEASELVSGLLLENRISLTLVRPELFFPPYDSVIKEMKKGRTPEELVEKCGFSLIQTAHTAVMNMNGLGESINWVQLLEKTKSLYEAGQQLEKSSKKLLRGEDIEWSHITDIARKVQVGQAGDFIPLSEVERGEIPFISSGWDNIDRHLGGIPEVGMVLIGGDPGIGKAQPLYSKVLTIDGWKTMKEINSGEFVFGIDGKPYEVLATFEHGNRPTYRVWFDDDTYTDCDEEHLWYVQSRKDRTRNKHSVRSLKEMMKSGLFIKEGANPPRKNYSVDFIDPVEFTKRILFVDPYLMGILISEGNLKGDSIVVSSGDQEILDKIHSLLPKGDKITHTANYDYRITKTTTGKFPTKTREYLNLYGLYGLKSQEKFIPKDYLYSSLEDRAELIRGLFDGDGCVTASGNNYVEYSTTSEQLAKDVVELCRGLGGRATVQDRMGQYNKDGKTIRTRRNYRILASFGGKLNPFCLSRKRDLFIGKNKHHKKYIEKVEFLGYQDVKCIYVDSKDHLYITDDYIITHNTTGMGRFASCFVRKHTNKKVAVFSLEMILCELATRLDEVEQLSKEEQSRILLCETPLNADAIINKAATIEDLGLICVDFADLVVEEDTENAYAKMYRTFMFGAKQLHVPIIVLVQLLKNKSGLPRPIHLRYTKMAEAFAWMILMLYDPSKDWDNDEKQQVLPVRAGAAYILCWKVRGGFRQHKDEAPGAIQLPFSGERGWSLDKSRWFSLKKVA